MERTPLDIKEVKNHDIVYVVEFYDGYIEGEKFSVQDLDTSYMSFVASYGTLFFSTFEEAEDLANELNRSKKR